jgi:hypothetical protein
MTDTTTTHYLYKGETTNGCICTEFDKNIADWIPRAECYGYCWEDQAEEFHNSIEEFMQGNPTHDFVITGFPVWYGDVSGVFEARTSMEFLSAVTVNGDAFEFNDAVVSVPTPVNTTDAVNKNGAQLKVKMN